MWTRRAVSLLLGGAIAFGAAFAVGGSAVAADSPSAGSSQVVLVADPGDGAVCPDCGIQDSQPVVVVDDDGNVVKRYFECNFCGNVW